jgi:hypothetical protein
MTCFISASLLVPAGKVAYVRLDAREESGVVIVLLDRCRHGYTQGMDAVRFGRALGIGARHAAKTVVAAVDAATAANPSSSGASHPETRNPLPTPHNAVRAPQPKAVSGGVAQKRSEGGQAQRGILQGSRRFRQATFSPFVRLSGVLVLEVAGVFFGIFALYGLSTVLRLRSEWHTGMPHHRQWLGGVIMLGVFGYFCVSSFLRARRRERQR